MVRGLGAGSTARSGSQVFHSPFLPISVLLQFQNNHLLCAKLNDRDQQQIIGLSTQMATLVKHGGNITYGNDKAKLFLKKGKQHSFLNFLP